MLRLTRKTGLAALGCGMAATAVAVLILTRSGAAIAQEPGCLPASSIPTALPALSSASDCVTGIATLQDQSVVIGTKHGRIALVRSGKIVEVQAVNSTGAVSDLRVEPLSVASSSSSPTDVIVTFAVDQGVGIFNPHTISLVQLDQLQFHRLDSGRLADVTPWIMASYYIKMSPEPGRPRLHSGSPVGTYVTTKKNGGVEYFALAASPDQFCGVYLDSPSAVPSREWCANVTSASPSVTAPLPVPTGPPGGDLCLAATTQATTDPSHQLLLSFSATGMQPSELQVQVGRAYALTLDSTDQISLYRLNIDEPDHQLARDQNGVRLCLTVPHSGHEIVP